jgi:hypothetical protein
MATKNSMKKNMNDVMSKLQEWLNGGMTGDKITQYCAEMGFQFYPVLICQISPTLPPTLRMTVMMMRGGSRLL